MAAVYLITEQTLQDIAIAIRETGGTTEPIAVEDYDDAIRQLTGCCSEDCYCHIEDADYNERGELVMQVWTHGKDPHVGCEILDAYFNSAGELICACGVYGAVWPDSAAVSDVHIVVGGAMYDLGTYTPETITDVGGDSAAVVLVGQGWYGVFSLGSYSFARTEALTDSVATSNVIITKEENT